jgi:lipopolysaccharide transport system ATP-binding protein
MEHVRESGRTVIFVSHNMPAITRLCPRTLLLESGAVAFDGPSHQAVGIYLGTGSYTRAVREWSAAETPGNNVVRLGAVRVRAEDGHTCERVDIRSPVGVEIEYEVLESGQVLIPAFQVINHEGVCVFTAIEHDPEWRRRPRPAGRFVSIAWIPGNLLSEGAFIIGVSIATFEPERIHVHERDVVAFHVVDSLEGTAARGDYAGHFPGVMRPVLKWTTRFTPADRAALDRVET